MIDIFYTQAQTFFRVITVTPGCFQLCSSTWSLQYICTWSLFPPKIFVLAISLLAGYFLLCSNNKVMCTSLTYTMTDLTDPSLLEEAVVLCHQLIGLMVNISSCCHYKPLSQPSKLSWTSVSGIVMLCYIICLVVLVFFKSLLFENYKEKWSEEILSKPNLRT